MKQLLIACLLGLMVTTPFVEAKENSKDHKNKQDTTDSKDHKNKQDTKDSKDHKSKHNTKKNKQDSSSTVFCNYASSSVSSQTLTSTTSTPIEFSNDLGSEVIEHPYQNDSASFQIGSDGMYNVSWTLTLEWDDVSQNIIDLHLYDAVNNDYLFANPVSTVSFDAIGASAKRYITISGQTLLSFTAGSVLQLHLSPSAPNVVVRQGLLTINYVCE